MKILQSIAIGFVAFAMVPPAAAKSKDPCRGLCDTTIESCARETTECRGEAKAVRRDARAACAGAASPAPCKRAARSSFRDARRACGRSESACRAVPLADCRRALREPVVPENVDLASCPVTPRVACSDLPPDTACTDALHPADRFFWDTFHAGNYAAIPEVLARLSAGLAERPQDPSLTRHLAWAHIWRLGESARGTVTPIELLESVATARPTFALSHQLAPADPRILGFLAAITFQEGVLTGDDGLRSEGVMLLEESVAVWPEFNYFTVGYLFSQFPAASEEFQRALEYQWKNVDVCSGVVIDRVTPRFDDLLGRETYVGRQRVCWNSWIAPHNIEGFFLNLGDMLVKSGGWQTGVIAYGAATISESYASWPYRAMLEARVRDAEANVAAFNSVPPPPGKTIMFNSAYSCAACHQAG